MFASGHGKPRNDPAWLWLQEALWNSREGSGTNAALGLGPRLCLQGPVQRLRVQPGASPSISCIAICAFKKHMAWHNAGSSDNGRNVAISSYFQCLYAVVFTGLLLFCVLKSCCPPVNRAGWVPAARGGEGAGEPSVHIPFLGRCLLLNPTALTAAKPPLTRACLEVLLPPCLLETNPSIKIFILELCWIFLTAKATWQYWRIPKSCEELGSASIVFSFHCLSVYKKMVTKLFSIKASKALDVVR